MDNNSFITNIIMKKKIVTKFQNFINELLKKFNLRLMKYKTYEKMVFNDRTFDFNFIDQIKNYEDISIMLPLLLQ